MKIQCPHCGVNGSADDAFHGLKVKCPKCQGIFVAAGEKAEEIEPAVEPQEVPVWSEIAPEIERPITEDEKRPEEAETPASPDMIVDDDRMVAAVPVQPIEKGESTAPGMEISSVTAGGAAESLEIPPTSPSRFTEMDARLAELDGAAIPAADGVERQPYGVDKEQCWQCGKEGSVGVPFTARDGRLYCPDCVTAAEAATDHTAGPDTGAAGTTDHSTPEARHDFTIGGVLRGAWAKTKGACCSLFGIEKKNG